MSCDNCACGKEVKKEEPKACPSMAEKVVLDAEGKCPCGKLAKDCCHKDELAKDSPDAIAELCAPHGGRQVC